MLKTEMFSYKFDGRLCEYIFQVKLYIFLHVYNIFDPHCYLNSLWIKYDLFIQNHNWSTMFYFTLIGYRIDLRGNFILISSLAKVVIWMFKVSNKDLNPIFCDMVRMNIKWFQSGFSIPFTNIGYMPKYQQDPDQYPCINMELDQLWINSGWSSSGWSGSPYGRIWIFNTGN